MKYNVTAHLALNGDVLELDDDLTEEEVENELFEYVCSNCDWNYRKIEEVYEKKRKELRV